MIASVLPVILATVDKFVDSTVSDEEINKRKKLRLEQDLLRQRQSVDLAQIEVIKFEVAVSPLQRSWLPTFGRVCTLPFVYHYQVQPMIIFTANLSGQQIPLPSSNFYAPMSVTIGLPKAWWTINIRINEED